MLQGELQKWEDIQTFWPHRMKIIISCCWQGNWNLSLLTHEAIPWHQQSENCKLFTFFLGKDKIFQKSREQYLSLEFTWEGSIAQGEHAAAEVPTGFKLKLVAKAAASPCAAPCPAAGIADVESEHYTAPCDSCSRLLNGKSLQSPPPMPSLTPAWFPPRRHQ